MQKAGFLTTRLITPAALCKFMFTFLNFLTNFLQKNISKPIFGFRYELGKHCRHRSDCSRRSTLCNNSIFKTLIRLIFGKILNKLLNTYTNTLFYPMGWVCQFVCHQETPATTTLSGFPKAQCIPTRWSFRVDCWSGVLEWRAGQSKYWMQK